MHCCPFQGSSGASQKRRHPWHMLVGAVSGARRWGCCNMAELLSVAVLPSTPSKHRAGLCRIPPLHSYATHGGTPKVTLPPQQGAAADGANRGRGALVAH
ncbi:hypothetical protein L7F22_000617 [Adiantum nelumboides]|nr:hypothetical protein [Adiantum nelumboides]